MAKEIQFSNYALLKIELLASHGIIVSTDLIVEAIRTPDKLELGQAGKFTAQKGLNEDLVLRVVYREYAEIILVITLYPGRRSRYEQDPI
jgi:hypothetical protein